MGAATWAARKPNAANAPAVGLAVTSRSLSFDFSGSFDRGGTGVDERLGVLAPDRLRAFIIKLADCRGSCVSDVTLLLRLCLGKGSEALRSIRSPPLNVGLLSGAEAVSFVRRWRFSDQRRFESEEAGSEGADIMVTSAPLSSCSSPSAAASSTGSSVPTLGIFDDSLLTCSCQPELIGDSRQLLTSSLSALPEKTLILDK